MERTFNTEALRQIINPEPKADELQDKVTELQKQVAYLEARLLKVERLIERFL
jgi:hypothetical protein